jgi:cyclohexa-1,5-dienecarbonyl-CoA hydratase
MSTGAAPVRREREATHERLILDRPPLHVLDFETIAALERALDEAIAAGARVIVLAASGDRAFSAGVDVRIHTPDLAPRMLREFHALLRRLLRAPAVTIAAVQGAALGGGLELALACDLVVAAEEATFGAPEIRLGCFPPIAISLLPALVGRQHAAEIVLTGEPFPAAKAEAMGLLNRVVPRAALGETVRGLAARLAALSPTVLRLSAKRLREAALPGVERAIAEAERVYLEELLPLPDCGEGVRAFLEKRPPRWEER